MSGEKTAQAGLVEQGQGQAKPNAGAGPGKSAEPEPPLPRWAYVVIWILCSASMILFNKYILDVCGFAFPMFLTSWHMGLSTVLTQLLHRYTGLLPSLQQPENRLSPREYALNIVPIALLFSVALVCSNSAYTYLSVSFMQMLKAMTPMAVLFLSFALRLEDASKVYIQIIACVCCGVAISSYGELEFDLTGFTLQFVAILAEASRLTLVNVLLRNRKLDPLSSLYYFAPACAVVIGITAFNKEGLHAMIMKIPQVGLPLLIANGLVACALNVSVVYLVKNTSALVLTLSGIFKDILLVVLSMMLFGAPVTPIQFAGYSLSLFGLTCYKDYKRNRQLFHERGLFGALAHIYCGEQ